MSESTARDGWDVIVCGGGPAGVAAALSAARNGARTLLFEATGCLGGMATAGNIPAFCPYANQGPALIRGIGLEILNKLAQRGGTGPGKGAEQLDWVPIDAERLKALLDDLLIESGVALRFFTRASAVTVESGRVTTLETDSKSGRETWSASVWIDATGDGDVAAMAGAPFAKGDEQGRMQAATLCFTVVGVDMERADAFARERGCDTARPLHSFLTDMKKTQLTHPGDGHVNFCQLRPGTLSFNYNHIYGADGTRPADLTRVMVEGRRMAAELVAFLRAQVPGCENAELARTAALPGVRETRRILGDYMLTGDDFDHARRHSDEIAVYGYPVDRHSVSLQAAQELKITEFLARRLPAGAYYGIPYRCLLPRGLHNVLVAGRAISSDRAMNGSLRVMPACFATGEAAGLAAVMAGQGNSDTRAVDVAELRTRLRAQGAFLPEND